MLAPDKSLGSQVGSSSWPILDVHRPVSQCLRPTLFKASRYVRKEEIEMSKAKLFVCAALLSGILSAAAEAGSGPRRTVIYNGAVHDVGVSFEQSNDLWLPLKDLTRVTRFVLKPQGMCYE